MKVINNNIMNNTEVQLCKLQLVEKKKEILNRLTRLKDDFRSLDKGVDEVDQSMNNLAENQFLIRNSQLRHIVSEIEAALARIQFGTFGMCEETNEEIEVGRLKSIPWTRLSIEGAEIRESLQHRTSGG